MSKHRDKTNLQAALERMARHDVPRDMLDKLERYLHEADDQELYEVNPRHIASKFETDIHTTLSFLAFAVQEGLFELNWEVHCPYCDGRARTFFSLRDSRSAEYCPQCQKGFDLHLDHEIHITFTVEDRVRTLSTQEPLSDELYPPTYGLELLNVQPFRTLFTDQVLPPGESLKVKRAAFLFTDLLGSTAMYAREGDPQAYGRVREHFEVLFRAADYNNGVTVKTIGDAVMASFVTPLDALRAAVEAYYDMKALNRRLDLSGDEALAVRLGTHVGPCISVTLNDQLDYFGATVNVASRVSRLSRGKDIVLTEAMLADQETRAEVAQNGEVESFESKLHGYEERFQLKRLVLRENR